MGHDSSRSDAEICMRCGAVMEWRHGTWQCGRCRLKIGCCEGATADCQAEHDASLEVVAPRPTTVENTLFGR